MLIKHLPVDTIQHLVSNGGALLPLSKKAFVEELWVLQTKGLFCLLPAYHLEAYHSKLLDTLTSKHAHVA